MMCIKNYIAPTTTYCKTNKKAHAHSPPPLYFGVSFWRYLISGDRNTFHCLVHWSVHQNSSPSFLNGFDETAADVLWSTHGVVATVLRIPFNYLCNTWLIGGFNPIIVPNIWKVIIQMFQSPPTSMKCGFEPFFWPKSPPSLQVVTHNARMDEERGPWGRPTTDSRVAVLRPQTFGSLIQWIQCLTSTHWSVVWKHPELCVVSKHPEMFLFRVRKNEKVGWGIHHYIKINPTPGEIQSMSPLQHVPSLKCYISWVK